MIEQHPTHEREKLTEKRREASVESATKCSRSRRGGGEVPPGESDRAKERNAEYVEGEESQWNTFASVF